MPPPDPKDLEALEFSLWDAETRFDRELMDHTFAADFFEFGRSGRRYTREEMLFDEQDAMKIDAQSVDMEVRPLSGDLALVTYVSKVRQLDSDEWGNRSSIWDRSSGRWQLRFHQGTPRKVPK